MFISFLEHFGVAGWYATTLNYVWPLALGLYGLSYIIQIISNEKISIAQQISYVVASLYAINQEQNVCIVCRILCFIYDI